MFRGLINVTLMWQKCEFDKSIKRIVNLCIFSFYLIIALKSQKSAKTI